MNNVYGRDRNSRLFGGYAERIDEEVTDNGVIFRTQLSGSRVHRFDDRVKAVFHHKFGLLDGISKVDDLSPNPICFLGCRDLLVRN